MTAAVGLRVLPLARAMDECLATHEVLRRLGIPAAEIHLHLAGNPPDVAMTVRRGDDNVFTVLLGAVLDDTAVVQREYARRAAWWNGTTDAERERIYQASDIVTVPGSAMGLILALQRAGLRAPGRPGSVVS